MRVITGIARGRKLEAPEGLSTRPTSDLVKEAVFSIIQFEVEGAAVLDLFAGSGQMGIEALSRGAKACTFVDQSKACHAVIHGNLQRTGLSENAHVVAMDALAYVQNTAGPFDIVFIDPPYQKGIFAKLLPFVAPLLRENGIILCETEKTEEMPQTAGNLQKHKEYRYGKTKITTYK